jgi:hypothetical protein
MSVVQAVRRNCHFAIDGHPFLIRISNRGALATATSQGMSVALTRPWRDRVLSRWSWIVDFFLRSKLEADPDIDIANLTSHQKNVRVPAAPPKE